MIDTVTASGAPALDWTRIVSDRLLWIGTAIGFTPVLAGLIFRTYGFHVAPGSAEVLRQLDVPFILVEVAVVLWAQSAGMRYRVIFARMDRPARMALLVFLGSFWLSSAFVSANPGYSMVRASFWFVHIAFAFAVFHLASELSRQALVRSGGAIVAGLFVFLPIMAAHLLTAPDPSSIIEGQIIWSSAIPGALSVRHLGMWSALVLALGAGALFVRDINSAARKAVLVVILVATATLFWSGTRSGVYGFAGAALFTLATLRRLPSWQATLAGVIAAAFGMLVSEMWLPPDPSFGIFNRASIDAGAADATSGRTILWASMMTAFAGSPLFGVGEGAIHWLAVIGDARHVQPHNSVVQMLSSWGIVACLPAGYLLIRLRLLAHCVARSEAFAVPLLLMMDCLLIMSLADGALYFSRFIMWFAAAAAVVLAIAVRGIAVSDATPQSPQPAPSARVR